MGQPENHPLLDWADYERFVPPKADVKARVEHIPAFAREHADKYIMAGLGISGFNLVTFLRGFNNTLMDFYAEREKIEELIDVVMDFECGLIRLYGELGCVDAVSFGDDWGMQDRLMIRPAMWREIFKPRYAKQFELAHSYGMDVYFHSCGYVYDIIGDWVELGVDTFNFNEPDLLGVERLGKDFGGKVCFCCALNHQRTALFGTKEELFDVAERLKRYLWVNGGGFMANIEDYHSLGMSEESYQNIVQAFERLNR
jgi:uroporphyrinogen-III decarboxylase